MGTDAHPIRQTGYLVVGGVSHDFDFVRLELLKLLAEHEHLRVTVAANYEDVEAIDRSGFLLSYTCDVRPSERAEHALSRFVGSGKRWFALHATNAHLEWTEDGVASVHTRSPFFTTLGSAFVAHPPMGEFRVEVTAPEHPLVRDIEPFFASDELYLVELFGTPEVLLATNFRGPTPGFVVDDWSERRQRPIMYLQRTGAGEVLYLNLGHARGHYDAPHRTPWYPVVERGAWQLPVFYELLRRGISWASETRPDTT
jgi:uncharacterized protein